MKNKLPHRRQIRITVLFNSFILLFTYQTKRTHAFVLFDTKPLIIRPHHHHHRIPSHYHHVSSSTTSSSSSQLFMVKSKRRLVTVSELAKTIQSQSDKNAAASSTTSSSGRRRRSRRTRKKSTNPQQTYIYASQRKRKTTDESPSSATTTDASSSPKTLRRSPNIDVARGMGLTNPSGPLQCCEAIEGEEPTIVAVIPLPSEDDFGNTNAFAYVIDKPVGWTVSAGKKKKNPKTTKERKRRTPKKETKTTTSVDNVISVDDDDDDETEDEWDYDIAALLSQMTPDEIRDFEREGGATTLLSSTVVDRVVAAAVEDMDDDWDEREVESRAVALASSLLTSDDDTTDDDDDTTDGDDDGPAFRTHTRPSILPWLKDVLSSQNRPIRGGKYWTALAGATNPHDSGLLLLVPKDKKHALRLRSTTYLAVLGNGDGDYLNTDAMAPPRSQPAAATILSHRKRRVASPTKTTIRDDILVARLVYADASTTVDDAVIPHVQSQFDVGVRGDPALDPLDRRAARRLVHVEAMAVAATGDDGREAFYDVTSERLPDDIVACCATPGERDGWATTRPNLGRDDGMTTAFREVNGDADGYPGWIVDRYGSYLRVEQRSDGSAAAATVGPMPPLPPVSPDGYTKGIYLVSNDRSTSSSTTPHLLLGTPPPASLLPIRENGITYLVSPTDKSSTGLFLDQRHQRSWLRRNVTPRTRLLNCFAHWGGYTVAAAVGGATETVSVDFDEGFLDRMKRSMEMNGIDLTEEEATTTRHDAIYGDCFDWIPRLRKKRGVGSFDIVILDPPSTSVSSLSKNKKSRRWSAYNDYDDLVSMTKSLVAPGGLLWTTNNCAKLHPRKFANMCWKGLTTTTTTTDDDDVGMEWILERVVGMPEDHPCVGTPPVTNLVWRRLK